MSWLARDQIGDLRHNQDSEMIIAVAWNSGMDE